MTTIRRKSHVASAEDTARLADEGEDVSHPAYCQKKVGRAISALSIDQYVGIERNPHHQRL